MRINNNLMATNTHRQYGISNTGLAKSAEKMASGYRINRAGDDAAGLAISEKMRAQVRGLTMASKNSQDAISLVQTAEGALQESHNILQRMRELAVQAGSDTNHDDVDREALDAEYQELMREVDETANKTKFNNMGVIDGTFSSMDNVFFDATRSVLPKGVHVSYDPALDATSLTETADGAPLTIVDNSGLEIGGEAATPAIKEGDTKIVFNNGIVITLDEPVTADEVTTPADLLSRIDPDSDLAIAFSKYPKREMTVQTGANQGDTLVINIERMDSGRLGIAHTRLATGPDARDAAIEACDAAVNQVSTQRGKLGALQNRLTHKIANLDTSAENLQAAESRIRDVDMAQEMTNYTKQNILIQASTAMLAQANSAPQNVLSLLQ